MNRKLKIFIVVLLAMFITSLAYAVIGIKPAFDKDIVYKMVLDAENIEYTGEINNLNSTNTVYKETETKITEEQAINTAREFVIIDLVKVAKSHNTIPEEVPDHLKKDTGGEEEISDYELMTGKKPEVEITMPSEFTCELDDTSSITAETMVFRDRLVWNVEIMDIKNSQEMCLGYFITIDAMSGKIINTSRCR